MKTSLGAILAIGLAGLQLVAVLIVVFTSYISSELTLIHHARNLLSDVGNNTMEHSKGFLQPAHGAAVLAAKLAQNKVVASEDQGLLEQLFFQQLQLSPQFSGIFYGDRAGRFVYVMRSDSPGPYRTKYITNGAEGRNTRLVWRDEAFRIVSERRDPEDTYDPRTRPWYTKALAERSTIWTDPYIFFSSQRPGITLAAPVFDAGGDIAGVMGVDIEIIDISRFLSRLSIGSTGKALIIHRNGDVIAHPDHSFISTPDANGALRFVKIWELADPIARSAFSGLFDRGALDTPRELSSQFTYDGSSYVSVVKPVISNDLPWTIAVYAPEDDFTAIIRGNRYRNLWIAVAVTAVTAFIGLLMANFIYRPVRAFAVRSALVSQGELDPSAPLPKTYKELERANAALMQQIAARKQTESEYGQTFERASRAIAQIEPADGRFIRANPKFCELTGYARDDLLQMRIADLASQVSPDPFAALKDERRQDVQLDEELQWETKDGRNIWVKFNAFVVRDEDGRSLYAVATVDDITEAKEKEKQIEKLNRDLSDLSKGHAMGRMATGLAHELNQPLAAIAQNADAALVAATRGDLQDDDLRIILTEIEQQALRAGDIIRALRSFVTEDNASRTSFDLAELAEQAERLVLAEAKEAAVKVGVVVADGLLVEANRTQVAQVIVNLLRNAIEALAQTEFTERRVTLSAVHTGDMVLVSVADTGPGIAPGLNLFTEFETTKPEGMGLGLSICRSIVEANDGSLWFDGGRGPGACFRFTLPADTRLTDRRGSEVA
ncbi:cache domain-containing protein [Sulfitobacter sp. LCG007]